MIRAEDIVGRYNSLKASRGTYEDSWQDYTKYCLPRKSYITRYYTPGTKFDYDVYDSTAIQSNIVLAAGLHSYLTNPSAKWFSLKIKGMDIGKTNEERIWLKQSEDKIYDTLNGSNFNQEIHEVYLDMGVIGTSCLFEAEDPKDVVRFFTYSIADVVIDEDQYGRVDTVIIKFTFTSRQAFQKWGMMSGEMAQAYEKKDFTKSNDYLFAVFPRQEYDPRKADNLNMPYAAIWIDYKQKKIMQEGGFLEMPFMVPRFYKRPAEVYGSGPAAVSYPDIAMLNKMSYTILRAAQKVVDPPLILPHDGFLLPLKLSPAALNYRISGNPQDRIEPLAPSQNIPIGREMEEQRRMAIRQNFFVDLFLLLREQKNMTATEVAERVSEKMLILSPALGRLMNELLDPIVSRTFNILLRNGQIPTPPESLQGREYAVEYTSILARAQKMEEVKSLSTFLTSVAGVAQFKPEVLDKINADEVLNEFSSVYNINPAILNDERVVKLIRAQRAQMVQMQQTIAAGEQAAKAAKDGTQAGKNLSEVESAGAK